ncbi:glycosyltransferase [Egicoccus sp. AB-alg2]|uniref:glycosyltransferase n=1 Tax=Egicoccus sp. AB-alg2 TaxID=3242693 RepID=UPI00359D17F3
MTAVSWSYASRARTHHRPLALFLPDLSGGGGERITLTLGHALSRLGLDVDLVVGSERGPLAAEVPPDVNLVDLDQRRLRGALPTLVRYLRVRRPGWIMPTIDHANVVGALAARAARSDTRVVLRPSTTMSLRLPLGPSPAAHVADALSRHCYRTADAVVACSRGMADDLASYCEIDRGRIDVIPNATLGPDVTLRARLPLDHPWFQDGAPPVVLGAGRLAPPKDFGTLLEAFAQVRRQRPVRLVVLGEGPEREGLLTRAAELGVADDVAMPGFDPNPYRYMARAGVFVLSSRREGLPGALIEAMACGTRVVATDCPSGAAEVLDDGRHGRLVPVGDATSMASAIAAALDDPDRPPPAAVERYRAMDVARAYLRVLERVVDAPVAA